LTLDLSDIIEALNDNPFEENPVDVVTFVTSKDFLNQPPLSENQYTVVECMSQIYREEDLISLMGEEKGKEHFKKYSKVEIILQCGKGSGKDHTSTIACAYIIYKLMCLKDPARYYGKPPDDAIDLINIAINAEQAKNVFFDNFVRKIKNSPWFAGKYDPKVNSVAFNKSITLYSGHSERESHEGLNLFLAILDEISGFASQGSAGNEQAKTAENIYRAFRGSVDSRFPDFGKVVLLSFPRYKNDFIQQAYDSAIAEKETIFRTHQFVLNPELPEDDPGNTFDIEWEEDHIISYKYPRVFALKRPTWEMNPTRSIEDFKIAFFKEPTDALMRFACMPTTSSDSFFKSREKIEKCLSIRNPLDSFRRFDPSFKPDPEKIYFLHADLAQRHDKCAIAISHVEKWVKMQAFNNYEQVVPFIVVDAIAWWEPRVEGPVDLSEVKNWIISLRRNGFNLGIVTFDRWQSFDIQRDLKSVGINSETLSVAKKHYEDLAMLIYEERVAAPHIELLLDEMLELRIMPNNKVDHPRKKSKDLADAMCGSVYNAISHSKREVVGEIEIHTWSSLKSEQNKKLIEEKQKPEMTEEIKDYLSSYRLL
jgi:hypothetical protein